MMRLLTTVCTACGGPSRDGNAFTFDEAGMAYRVEFRTENTVRILVRPAGSPLVTQRLVVDSVPAAPVEVRRERAIGRGMDGADFDRRVANQPAEEYLRAHADTALDNSGAPERLAAALDAWWAERESSGWGKARG